jgi:hypothetical protein
MPHRGYNCRVQHCTQTPANLAAIVAEAHPGLHEISCSAWSAYTAGHQATQSLDMPSHSVTASAQCAVPVDILGGWQVLVCAAQHDDCWVTHRQGTNLYGV